MRLRILVRLVALAALLSCDAKRPPAPEDVPGPSRRSPAGAKADDAWRPQAPRPRFGAPPDRPLYVILGRKDFARWYRAHAPELALPAVADDLALGDFATDVVEPLGRIPRQEILRVLLTEYLARHAALREIELQWRNASPRNRGEDSGGAAREAAAKRAFFEKLYGRIAYSDLLLLAHSPRWELADVPPPPTGERPAGGDPYAGPVAKAIAGFERRLAPWYRAYRLELDLPDRDAAFLDEFQWEVLQWLGRLPKPELLRRLVEAYTPLHAKWKQRTVADRDQAVRDFFAALRSRLPRADYARIAGSAMWKDDCRLLGIPLE